MAGASTLAIPSVPYRSIRSHQPAHAPGTVDVAVANSNGSDTLPAAYTYEIPPPPTVTAIVPSQGIVDGGTVVTITGTNLSVLGDVTVEFGPNAGTVLDVVGGITLTVVTPPGSVGTVSVTVTTSGGVVSLPFGFVYTLQNEFMRGDPNSDGIVGLADAIFVLFYLFNQPAPGPTCFDSADMNDDGGLDITDGIYLIEYLFNGGSLPLPPFPGCGVDPTDTDILDCQLYAPC